MPQQKGAHNKRRQDLQRRAADLRRQLAAEQGVKESAQSRQQVLTDLCQITEGLLWLQRVRQQVSVADDSRPAPEDRDGDASAQQQQKIAAALAAVPQYCCCADLMQKATPELLRLVLSFSDKDISRLFVDTFTEVLTLMELSSRPAAAAAPAAPAAPAQGAPDSTQGPAHPVPESELQDAIDRFFGILLLAFACQPMPLFNAACINHRTGQQVEPPAHHWMGVTQRVALLAQQAMYLGSALDEVRHVRKKTWWQLRPLLQEATSPSLQLLAEQQRQQQPNEPGQQPWAPNQQQAAGQQPCSGDPNGRAPADGEGAPAPCAQLLSGIKQLTMYGALVALHVSDTLTVSQKARWIIASFPWLPAPVVLCTCAASLQEQDATQHLQHQHRPQQPPSPDGGPTSTLDAVEALPPQPVDAGVQGQRLAEQPPAEAAGQQQVDTQLLLTQLHAQQRRQHWWQRLHLQQSQNAGLTGLAADFSDISVAGGVSAAGGTLLPACGKVGAQHDSNCCACSLHGT